MSKNTPAFQYYPADLISDPDVMFWDMEMMGCYWQMITYLWLNGGKFEFNLDKLRVLFRFKRKKKAEKLWLKIRKKFVIKDGFVTHKRVTGEMQKQAESRLRRETAGKKGAEKRWEGHSKANSKAIPKTIAKNSPSSSSSTTTSTTVNKYYTLDEVKSYAVVVGMTPNQANSFWEHYESQGWLKANGLPITNLGLQMQKWKREAHKFDYKKGIVTAADRKAAREAKNDL